MAEIAKHPSKFSPQVQGITHKGATSKQESTQLSATGLI
jgi:hypothetical protein